MATRNPECVKEWPDCREGAYNPSCCRFPKSCRCGGDDAQDLPVVIVAPAGLNVPVRLMPSEVMYVPGDNHNTDTDAELDQAYIAGAALVVERDELKAQVQRLTEERAELRDQLAKARTPGFDHARAEGWKARAERDEAKVLRLEGTLTEQARALELLTEACKTAKADHDTKIAKAIEALEKVDDIACRNGPIQGYGEEPPEPLNPDGCELALLARETIAALRGGP